MRFRRRKDREGEIIIKEKFVVRPKYCVDTKVMHCFEFLWRKRILGNDWSRNRDTWYKNGGHLVKNVMGGRDEAV